MDNRLQHWWELPGRTVVPGQVCVGRASAIPGSPFVSFTTVLKSKVNQTINCCNYIRWQRIALQTLSLKITSWKLTRSLTLLKIYSLELVVCQHGSLSCFFYKQQHLVTASNVTLLQTWTHFDQWVLLCVFYRSSAIPLEFQNELSYCKVLHCFVQGM